MGVVKFQPGVSVYLNGFTTRGAYRNNQARRWTLRGADLAHMTDLGRTV